MRFSKLSDETLLHSFREAYRLRISPEFIKLLELEIMERGLNKSILFNKKFKKIN